MTVRLSICLLVCLFVPTSLSAQSLSVVTYNVWHGLGQMDGIQLRELENRERREDRFQWFVQQLRETAPDLVLLQEVNPVAEYTKGLVTAVPGYKEIHQADNCGFKVAGVGIPTNFHQGLAILAREGLELDEVGYERLSGNAACSDYFGRQTRETHIVLAGRILWNGKAILVLNTHLFGEASTTPFILDELEGVRHRNQIPRGKWKDIVEYLDRGTKRRKKEIERLAAWIRLRMEDYDGMILGGDLNAEPYESVLSPLKDLGLVDAVQHMNRPVATIDVSRNAANLALESTGWSSRDLDDLSIPRVVKREIQAIFQTDYYRPKRLDYIFVSNPLKNMLEGSQAYMDHASPKGHLASDHLGLLVELTPQETLLSAVLRPGDK